MFRGILGFLLLLVIATGIFGFGGFVAVSLAGFIQIFFYILFVALVISIIMRLLTPPPPQPPVR